MNLKMRENEELSTNGSFTNALVIFAIGLIGGRFGWLAMVISLGVFVLVYYLGLYKPLKKLEKEGHLTYPTK